MSKQQWPQEGDTGLPPELTAAFERAGALLGWALYLDARSPRPPHDVTVTLAERAADIVQAAVWDWSIERERGGSVEPTSPDVVRREDASLDDVRDSMRAATRAGRFDDVTSA